MPADRVAYFINQYPKVSHSFIRREIVELERQGIAVTRIALRGWDAELVDEGDIEERKRTRYLLQDGIAGLVPPLLRTAVRRPLRLLKALGTALSLGRGADRPLPYHLVYLAEACALLEWLEEAEVSHVHSHFGSNSTEVVLLTAALGGPPYSFTVHGPEEFDKPGPLKLREKIHGAAFVVAISSFCRSQLFRWAELADWDKVHVVRCGIEQAFYSIPPEGIADAPRLVCVGRLCEQKGQLLLVEACALLKERGVDFELVLAGDGEMRAEVEAQIALRGLQSHIRITGWISSDRVRDELLAARALVLPSFAEGLPVVIMEAMALRRPAITTYVAGIPELVRSGVDGLLVPPGDVDALADAIAQLLAMDAEQLREVGESAFARVTGMHAIETEVTKLRGLLLETVGQS